MTDIFFTGLVDEAQDRFPAPIYASLVEAEDGESHALIWSRRTGDRSDSHSAAPLTYTNVSHGGRDATVQISVRRSTNA